MRREEGSVTAFTVTFTVALLALAGLVIDGGLLLAARRQVTHEAEASARAAAQAIDIDALRRGDPLTLDPLVAVSRGRDHLAALGRDGTVEVEGDRVRVEVTVERPFTILAALGVGPAVVVGTGEARAVRGVQEADD